MSALTFLQMLKSEVGRMQAAHPAREGEIARAHALILHGMVVPSSDDPETGQVLSSDLTTTYSVNGSCTCQAGQHGKDCKHMHAWKLYQYIARKMEEQTASPTAGPLPEAPASVNCHITIEGRQVQLTLRDTDEGRLLERLAAVLQQHPVEHKPQPQGPPQGTGWCAVHNVEMQEQQKDGRRWFSHRTQDGWCKGKVK